MRAQENTFPVPTNRNLGIVDALRSVGVADTSLEARRRIGAANGINNVGSATSNKAMLDLLHRGRLVRA